MGPLAARAGLCTPADLCPVGQRDLPHGVELFRTGGFCWLLFDRFIDCL
jgi:hypothetical protein